MNTDFRGFPRFLWLLSLTAKDEREMNGPFSIHSAWVLHIGINKAGRRQTPRMPVPEVKTMTRTMIAAALITASFTLGAWTSLPRTGDLITPGQSHVTVIQKNQVWPVKTRMSMDPCAVSACQEV